MESDQYTKPRCYEGMDVPDVLTNGNHKRIWLWQLENALRRTADRRPDLFNTWLETRDEKLSGLTKRERKELEDIINELKRSMQG